jgi:hypothetical protein
MMAFAFRAGVQGLAARLRVIWLVPTTEVSSERLQAVDALGLWSPNFVRQMSETLALKGVTRFFRSAD